MEKYIPCSGTPASFLGFQPPCEGRIGCHPPVTVAAQFRILTGIPQRQENFILHMNYNPYDVHTVKIF